MAAADDKDCKHHFYMPEL